MQAKIGKLWPQTHFASLFPIYHFVRNHMHNLKNNGDVRTFYPWNDSSITGDIYSLG